MNGYYVADTIPEAFIEADKRIKAEREAAETKESKPRVVPMPTINSNPNIHGPIRIDKEWYENKKKKKDKKREKTKKEYEAEIIRLLARKDMLRHKLNKLNPGKKKDSKLIAAINIQIKDIDRELSMLETQSGIHINEVDNGSKIGRFLSRLKQRCKKIVKKVKRFFKRNKELITGILSVVLPVFGTFIFKRGAKT